MHDENLVFARNLRAARERAGMSQQELAEKLGVKRQDVGHWESGRHLPRLPVARRLSQVLGVSLESLFSGEGPEHKAAAAEPAQCGEAPPDEPIPAAALPADTIPTVAAHANPPPPGVDPEEWWEKVALPKLREVEAELRRMWEEELRRSKQQR